jgi:hypothetical protein
MSKILFHYWIFVAYELKIILKTCPSKQSYNYLRKQLGFIVIQLVTLLQTVLGDNIWRIVLQQWIDEMYSYMEVGGVNTNYVWSIFY